LCFNGLLMRRAKLNMKLISERMPKCIASARDSRRRFSREENVMTQQIKNVVLVHGAFADGSGWAPVASILKNNGYKVSVPQPPETSYADDQKYTKAAIDAMGGPVVLVGHSYGGSIITEAGNHPKVAALVYIAAFALDEVRAAGRSNRPCRKPPRRSSRIATATGG
jgi:pimeloyl-ACP methyl ester carboxylesterase